MAKDKKKKPEAGEAATPAAAKLSRKACEAELARLHAERVKLQFWVKKRQRVIVLFEGRDAAGKGGVIKRLTERVSPRVFRVAALPAPTGRERSQIFIQRFMSIFRPRARS